jgi:hypothetical protein
MATGIEPDIIAFQEGKLFVQFLICVLLERVSHCHRLDYIPSPPGSVPSNTFLTKARIFVRRVLWHDMDPTDGVRLVA